MDAELLDRNIVGSDGGERVPPRAVKTTGPGEELRAELSDVRRSILHRQERDALAVLAAHREKEADASAARAHEALLLRADLIELALLKQARAISAVRDALEAHSRRFDELAASVAEGPGGRQEDPRHVVNLNARLEAVELWLLRSTPA